MKTKTVTWEGTGDWIDEEDVRDKFQNKPTQRDYILQNAKTYTNPSTNAKLYEVMTYKSHYKSEEKRTEERKRQLNGQQKIKGAKKIKVTKKAATEGEEPVDEPKVELPKFAAKRIETMLPKFQELTTQLANVITEAKAAELQPYIPKHVIEKADALESELATFIDLLVDIQRDGCGKNNLKKVLATINLNKRKCDEMTEKLTSYVEDAEEALFATKNAAKKSE